ncbi:mdj1 protein precursor [Coemansia sp. Benny D115]|nr:mdj1 protein precursor [Coemansia sp. Benny D115]
MTAGILHLSPCKCRSISASSTGTHMASYRCRLLHCSGTRCSEDHRPHRYSSVEATRMLARLRGADAYQTLGIDRKATAGELKSKYYELCRQLHPDTAADRSNTAATRERFVAVQDAYAVLSDPQLRRYYDGKQTRQSDPWARERPHSAGGWKSERERKTDRLVAWGLVGFAAVTSMVLTMQKLVVGADTAHQMDMHHWRSVRMLEDARERARERWREVPREYAAETEARRLRAAQRRHSGDKGGRVEDDWLLEWQSRGVGLGLLPLLGDRQLCGLGQSGFGGGSAADAKSVRCENVRRALQGDRIVQRYVAEGKAVSRACGPGDCANS